MDIINANIKRKFVKHSNSLHCRELSEGEDGYLHYYHSRNKLSYFIQQTNKLLKRALFSFRFTIDNLTEMQLGNKNYKGIQVYVFM